MSFEDKLRNKQERVNTCLKELLRIKEAPPVIVEAMNYSLMIGGKRIRPVLALSICEALGGDMERILPFACSIELIHTYSLIHDDLPAMDNDDLRRGKPTNHKVFGEAMAILAGDGLLNFAFETMLETVKEFNYEPGLVRAAALCARSAGIRGMIGGQVIDMNSEGKAIDINTLYEMHSRKTGALIEAACTMAGIICAKEEKLDEIGEYSRNLGVAFQIVDDILDYVGDSDKLGKKVGSDRDNEKSTFVSILGLEKARELAENYSIAARRISDRLDSSGFLSELTDFLLRRDY